MREEEVIQYLLSTPDFFIQNADVLEYLTLPHPVNGKVISLLEYQVEVMKKSNASYRAEFECLVEVARENESTLQKSRRLVLAGLGCQSLDDFAEVVGDMVRNDFQIPHHSLILFDSKNTSSIRSHSLTEDDPQLTLSSNTTECFCGELPKHEMDYIFSESAEAIKSVAVLPLLSRSGGEIKKCGVLVLGAEKSSEFDKEKGTLFLQYLADLLSATLLRIA
ncbi:DUF484 family protein [Marinomonas sp. C2222]|uniref:DUF484 family protein n=1 Tax=Marinomonas sargassi TaxID=2984494 RepID=A0ABT2YUZ5_9GAMM|nr:DUF484 family protein [Marinomonas sargassi]MCV2403703.1 DUF484 family protein [Marinomonas sargassi]